MLKFDILDDKCICSVKYGVVFTIARPFFDTKFFFMRLFGISVFLR